MESESSVEESEDEESSVEESEDEESSVEESEEEEEVCLVCCEKFTSQVRKPIVCTACDMKVCMVCFRKYLVNLPDDPHCMGCKHGFSSIFLYEELPRTYMMKEWASSRKDILLSREKSLLPSTQNDVTRELNRRKDKKEVEKTREKIKKMKAQIKELQHHITTLQMHDGEKKKEGDDKKFIHPCPTDDCRGFLSTGYKCPLCEVKVCSKCHGIKRKPKKGKEGKEESDDEDIPHVCKKKDKLSVQQLKKETKPCPSCGAPIYRISGCDQMFCTSCGTPFSWRTGKVIKTNAFHNPHYDDWRRVHGEITTTPRDECALDIIKLGNRMAKSHLPYKNDYMNYLKETQRIMYHIQDVEIPKYVKGNDMNVNKDLRVRYLLKEINEDVWKRYLANRERDRERSQSIRLILATYCTVGRDCIAKLNLAKDKEYETVLKEVKIELMGMVKYVNTELKKLKEIWKCVVPRITTKDSDIQTWDRFSVVYDGRKKRNNHIPNIGVPVNINIHPIPFPPQ